MVLLGWACLLHHLILLTATQVMVQLTLTLIQIHTCIPMVVALLLAPHTLIHLHLMLCCVLCDLPCAGLVLLVCCTCWQLQLRQVIVSFPGLLLAEVALAQALHDLSQLRAMGVQHMLDLILMDLILMHLISLQRHISALATRAILWLRSP